jgi:ABC-type cobalamin/Fe3+-siderophores transport system ATPase subunit
MQLFKDNYKFRYNIKYNGDDILQMSPGKRGLVLLQIILHLSNAKHPILIDQPEDNLDNRTIYIDLNDFVKKKKIQRQILLVTHNANLVVSTDAEEVIVANQKGQDAGKDNENYQFEYVTGSLENTFKDKTGKGILKQMGIREHVCDILEGGEEAFTYRERKYGFRN